MWDVVQEAGWHLLRIGLEGVRKMRNEVAVLSLLLRGTSRCFLFCLLQTSREDVSDSGPLVSAGYPKGSPTKQFGGVCFSLTGS